ncbi:hypothetical protein TNCV_2309141 [Trichonephila clavipes]|nr:hypothetical protein TNCV_2309141 [Trichonephila clavipes]
MGMPYHPGIKVAVDGTVTDILSRQGQTKQTLSRRMIMTTVFWDWRGVFLVDFMPQGTTINSDIYCVTLQKLRRALQTNGVACGQRCFSPPR